MSEDKFKPTKLEWLALSMQAWVPMLLSQMRRLHPTQGVDDVRVFFKAAGPSTIRVTVRHVATIPQDVVAYLNTEIEREIGEIRAGHGWDQAMEIQWDVR